MTAARTPASRLVKAGFAVATAVLGTGLAPLPASADGPGYGGNADALTVVWESNAQRSGLAVYAVGFRSGSPVRVRVGSDAERTVVADRYGAVDLLFIAKIISSTGVTSVWKPANVPAATGTTSPADGTTSSASSADGTASSTDGTAGTGASGLTAATGASVLVVGHTPAGELRTLVGAVPPQMTERGAAELIPWLAVLAGSLMAGLWLRRRYGSAGGSRPAARHRHLARHRA